MSGHHVDVLPLKDGGGPAQYRASCELCGSVGPRRDSEWMAKVDAAAHHDDTMTDVPPGQWL